MKTGYHTNLEPLPIPQATELMGQAGRNAFLLAMQMQERHAPSLHHEDRDSDYWHQSHLFNIAHLELA